MDKDTSIAIQKQARNNAEDLRNEFLDMKNWEEKMKQADLELRNSTDDIGQSLPPVRKKKSCSRPKPKPKENGSKAKRIKSYDYSAWDQFDADKACEEIDKENESEDSGEEILSKEALEKNHEEATKHKTMGNNYVKEGKWDKAMACYNEAIKIFPYDAVFYANRALCHLKMDNLYSAEADCTSAIQRDEHYVKAYHRRATARMALKQYQEAIQDLKKFLSLESTNKEAQKMLSTAMKCLDNSKSVITTYSKDVDVQERNADDINRSDKNNSVINEAEKGKQVLVQPVVLKESASVMKEKRKKFDQLNDVKCSVKSPKIGDWLPVVDENVSVVQPINKLPHQRSSQNALKVVSVELTDFSKWPLKKDGKSDGEKKNSSAEESKNCCQKNSDKMAEIKKNCGNLNGNMEKETKEEIAKEAKKKIKKEAKEEIRNETKEKNGKERKEKNGKETNKKIEKNEIILDFEEPIPRTAVQFRGAWVKHKLPEFRYKYLKQITPASIPNLFQNSMESDIFSDILRILRTEFLKNGDDVFQYLKFLSEIKRFRTFTMFLPKQEKKDLEALFDACKNREGINDDVIKEYRVKYEI